MQDQSSLSKLDDYLIRLSQNDPTCTIIDLSNCYIARKGIKRLEPAFKNTTITIATLNLSGNGIGPKSIRSLGSILEYSSRLTSLNFSHNQITNEIVQLIASELEIHRTLVELNLSHNHLSANSGEVVAQSLQRNRTLRILNLSHNRLCDGGAVALANTLYKNNTTLKELSLSKNGIGNQGVSTFSNTIVVNRSLRRLDLSHNNIWDDDADALIDAFKSRKKLFFEEMEEAREKREQESDIHFHLSLNGNWISAEQAQKLAKTAADNKDDVDVTNQRSRVDKTINPSEAMSNQPTIFLGDLKQGLDKDKKIDRSHRNLDDQKIKVLIEKLCKNTYLTEFYISHNKISAKGISSLLAAIPHKDQLVHLDVSHNPIGIEEVEPLTELLGADNELRALFFSGNRLGDEGVIQLTESLHNNTTLTHLNLSENAMTGIGAEALERMLYHPCALTILDVSNNHLNNRGAAALGRVVKARSILLRSLNFANNHCSNINILADALAFNRTLTHLNLSGNPLEKESVEKLKISLRMDSRLQSLHLSNCQLYSRKVNEVAEIIEFYHDVADPPSSMDYSPKYYCAYNSLRDLNLSDNEIGAKGHRAIIMALSRYCSLTRLDLSGTGFGDTEAKLLVKVLRDTKKKSTSSNPKYPQIEFLTRINLYLSRNNIGYAGALALAKLLKIDIRFYDDYFYHNLYYLDVSYNKIDDRGAEALATALRNRFVQYKVPLEGEKIDTVNHSRVYHSRSCLNISWNKLSNKSIELLKAAKKANNLIEEIVLDPQQSTEGTFATTQVTAPHLTCHPYKDRDLSTRLQPTYGWIPALARTTVEGEKLPAHKDFKIVDQSSLFSSLSSAPSTTQTTQRQKSMLLQRFPKILEPLPCFIAAPETSSGLWSGERTAILPLDNPPSRKDPKLLGTAIKYTNPLQIPGWELQDVPAQGNCFYEAVVHQFHQIHHAFLNTVPAGTAPRDSLRLRIQGREFNDGEWADEEQIILLALQFNVIVAIADTRYPANHFRYLYFDEKGDYKYANNPALLPKEKSIIQLAFTGNHYLSVVHALPRPDLHQRINMLRQTDVQKMDVPHKVDIPKESDSHKSELQEKVESLQERMERLRQEREKKAADSYSVINFSDSDIGDQDAERLAMQFRNNKACTYLDLSNTGMGDRGFEKFVGVMCQNGVLAELYFEDNRISVEGTKFFGAILARNKTLKIISLSGNSLGDEGVKALAAGISYNTTLECLMLSGNDLTSNGIKYLVEAIFDKKNIKVLDLSHNKIGYEGMSILTRLVHQGIITHLDISHSGVWSQDVKGLTETLKTNTTLQFLDLSGNKIENDAARLLAMAVREAGNAALIEGGLYFGKPRIPTKDEKREEDEVAVTEKEDASPKFVTAEELTILLQRARRASLPCLDEPDPARIAALQIQLKTLEENKSSSTFLNFSNDSIGDVGVQRLAETLHDKETLQSLALALSQCHIGDAGIVTLAARLDANPHIQLVSLDLSNNSIGADGAMGLTLVMSQRTLVYLNLRHNQLGPHGVGRLMMGFHGDQTLQYLDLSSNILHDEGAIKLAKTLCVINALIVLKISNNQIGNKGAAALATALELSKTLTELDLSDNELNHEGMKALADAFFKHTAHLENLNLARNDIGVKGAKVLRDGLYTNHCLWYLNIDKNNIGDKGAGYIADLIKHNTALRQLTLKNNRIGVKSLTDLTGALGKNKKTRLAEMGIEGNKTFLPVFWKVMTPILRNNHFLHVIENLREVPARRGSHLELPNDIINKIFSYDEKMAAVANKKDQDQMLREVWKRLTDEELEKGLQKITKKTLWGTLKQGFFSSSNRRGPSGGQPQPSPQSRL